MFYRLALFVLIGEDFFLLTGDDNEIKCTLCALFDSCFALFVCLTLIGEDDFRVCRDWRIIDPSGSDTICPVDANGNFTDEIPDFSGRFDLIRLE